VGSTWGPTDDIQQLLRDADAHMYRHKARQSSRQSRMRGPSTSPSSPGPP
jgi:hypothetical protein